MHVTVKLESGCLPDAYGKYASPQDLHGWSCRRSFPFVVDGIPSHAAALAVFFVDWDSVPVCGFPWIHWCAYVAGPFDKDLIVPDDASRTAPDWLIQGYNSAQPDEPERGFGYVGPCPPDKEHRYTLRVVALSSVDLPEAPFYANELVEACRGNVLDVAEKVIPSRC